MGYERIVQAGYAANPVAAPPPGPKRRGRRKQSKACNLLDRFRDHPDSVLAWKPSTCKPSPGPTGKTGSPRPNSDPSPSN